MATTTRDPMTTMRPRRWPSDRPRSQRDSVPLGAIRLTPSACPDEPADHGSALATPRWGRAFDQVHPIRLSGWTPGSLSVGPLGAGAVGSDRDDRSIVASVLDGDRDAFRLLVDRESAAMVRACDRMLADHAEAEDVAQEAFVTAYRSAVLLAWRRALRRVARPGSPFDSPFGERQAGRAVPAGVGAGATRAMPPAATSLAIDANATDPAVLTVRAERSAGSAGAVAQLGALSRGRRAPLLRRAILDDIARRSPPAGHGQDTLHAA